MKKLLIITLLLITMNIFSMENDHKTSSSISAGTEYLEDFYINFGYSIIRSLDNNMELDFKLSLDIRTEEDQAGDISPEIIIPFKANINFLFPATTNLVFLTGAGLSPTVQITNEETNFLMGPNVKAGIRYKVHPSMSIFLEACQGLLIGGEDWIYSSTEIVFGTNFYFK